MKHNHRSQQGLSVIELLAAVVVIVVVIVSIVSLTTNSLKLSQQAQYRQKAITYAREGIEIVRSNRDTHSWSDFVGFSYDSDTYKIISIEEKNVFCRLIQLTDQNGNDLDVGDTKAHISVLVLWNDIKNYQTTTCSVTNVGILSDFEHHVVQDTIIGRWQ
jgi:Tfp pilus assembly protein PilV